MKTPADGVELTGCSRKGKNIVKTFGVCWRILKQQDTVSCYPNKNGPFILIRPWMDLGNINCRWVSITDDDNFIAKLF